MGYESKWKHSQGEGRHLRNRSRLDFNVLLKHTWYTA